MSMLYDPTPDVPSHVVDLFARSAEVQIDLTVDHAPHRLLTFLYGDASFHDRLMQLNTKSALSVRSGDTFHLYDKKILGKLNE
jgi:hypothetical protein